MTGVWLLARLTLVEALRRRIATAALCVGAAFLLVFGIGLHFIHRDIQAHAQVHGPTAAIQAAALVVVVMAGLYAATFLAMMAAVVFALDTLAGEIGSGVIETLCTKPIRRSSILLGKWLGCVGLVSGFTLLLLGGVLLIGRAIGGVTPPHVLQPLSLILLEGVLLMTVALACGTRMSPLASGMVVFGLYGLAFVGGWVEQIGTMAGNASARLVGIVASLVMPSDALWRLASYLLQPPLVRDAGITPFTVASVPSTAMVLWAVGYVAVALGLAARLLSARDL
jgi:Cu-processing system permease protein